MATSSSSSSFVLLLLLFLFVVMESWASPHRDDAQVFPSLFDSHLSALILAPPTSDYSREESETRPSRSHLSPLKGLDVNPGTVRGLANQKEVVSRFFLDFLRRQAKVTRRSRKSMVGGRGCFGMKMDRIGSLSGLGC